MHQVQTGCIVNKMLATAKDTKVTSSVGLMGIYIILQLHTYCDVYVENVCIQAIHDDASIS